MGKHIFIKDTQKNNENNSFQRVSKEEIEEKRISAYQPSLNDLQLYELYCSIPKWTVHKSSRIYPKYVVITGRAFSAPHPHRHFTFEEFLDCLYKDENFKNVILGRN